MPRKRPYEQFCPVATSLDLVGDRWTLLIVRELLVGPVRYGEIHTALAPISTDVLANRLRELEANRLVVRSTDGGYSLTDAGADLTPVLGALARWGVERLAPPTGPAQLTVARALQMLVLANRDVASLEQVVEVQAEPDTFFLAATETGYRAGRGRRDGDAGVVSAVVSTDGPTLWAVAAGELAWADAVRGGDVRVDGDASVAEALLARRLPAGIPATHTTR